MEGNNLKKEKGYVVDERPPEPETIYQALIKYRDHASAIAELIDNCAEYRLAKYDCGFISLFLSNAGAFDLVIADDARAMDYEEMKEALQFKQQSHNDDALGKYGYGLKAAAYFLSRKFKILSKKDGIFTFGEIDYTSWDNPCQTLTDIKKIRSAEKIWQQYNVCKGESESGTILMFGDLKVDVNSTTLKKDLGIIFNKIFQKKNITMCFDGETLPLIDIKGDPIPGGLDNDHIPGLLKDGKQYPPFTLGTYMHPPGAGTDNSGICLGRNSRIVGRSLKLGFPKLGPNYTQSTMRGYQVMVDLPPEYDELMGVNPNKTIDPHQAIDHDLRDYIWNSTGLKQITEKIFQSGRAATERNMANGIGFLNQISKLVNNYNKPVQTIIKTEEEDKSPKESKGERGEDKNKSDAKPGRKKWESGVDNYKGAVKFDFSPSSIDDPEWDFTDDILDNGKPQTVITFNTAHPIALAAYEAFTATKPNVVDEYYKLYQAYFEDVVTKVWSVKDGSISRMELLDFQHLEAKLRTSDVMRRSLLKKDNKKCA